MVKFNENLPEDLRRKLEAKMANSLIGDLKAIDETLQARGVLARRAPAPLSSPIWQRGVLPT